MDQFDSLKREATKLERSLEDKVARYQQVRMIDPATRIKINQHNLKKKSSISVLTLILLICLCSLSLLCQMVVQHLMIYSSQNQGCNHLQHPQKMKRLFGMTSNEPSPRFKI
jgi:hypothetical protein